MKDRHGVEYQEAIEIQNAHMARWESALNLRRYGEVLTYVRKHNREAVSAEDVHQVWRGQSLATIIFHWPDLPAPYPPIHDPSPADLI